MKRKEYQLWKKRLGCQLRIGKYGIKLLPKDFNGGLYKLAQIIPLWGWTSDPHEVLEAFANDPNFSIKYESPTEATQERKDS